MIRVVLPGVLIAAMVSTLGDYIWYEFDVRHQVVLGVLHGAVLLMTVGGVIGASTGRAAAGLPLGAAAGIGGALSYYVLSPLIGRGSMLAAWAIVWLLLAAGEGRLLRSLRRTWSEVLLRGILAAALSGAAFYAVLGLLWGREPEGGRNYLVQFLAWVVAWAPGILALTFRREGMKT